VFYNWPDYAGQVNKRYAPEPMWMDVETALASVGGQTAAE
jgi:hypothetical protein